MPCGDESSEEHSCGYVTSERHSRKAKEPRPFGLLPLKRLAVLVLRTAVTLRQKNTAVRSTDGIYDPAAVVTLRQKNTAVRSTSLLAPCQTLQENATRPMATFAMSSRCHVGSIAENSPKAVALHGLRGYGSLK